MPDKLADVASQLDAQITKMIGPPKSSPSSTSMESAMPAEVVAILKDAGVANPEEVISKIEAAGYKLEKTGTTEPKAEADKEIGKSPGASMDMEDTTSMPMKDARSSAAKFAFGNMK